MLNPCTERYRFISMIRHELIKRSIKSSRRLGCLYYYIYILRPGNSSGIPRCIVVTLFSFLNRLDREAEKVNQINSWRTSGLNQKCYLSVVVPKHAVSQPSSPRQDRQTSGIELKTCDRGDLV